MDRAEFNADMVARGMRPYANGVIGIVDGYPMIAAWINKKMVSLSIAVDKGDWDRCKKELKAEFKSFAATTYDGKRFIVNLKSAPMADVYEQGLRETVRHLREHGIFVPDVCGLCGRSGCNAAAVIGNSAMPIHTDCIEGAVQNAQEKAKQAAVSGNYATGFVGAFIGALVGCIPSFLTIVFMSTIYALAFALIPLGAYHGYRLAKGRMDKMACAAAILMSVVGVFALEWAQIFYGFLTEPGLDVTFGDLFPALLRVPEVWQAIFSDPNFYLELVFAGLGVLFVWSNITRTAASDVVSMEAVRNTCIPYTRSAPAAPVESYTSTDSTGY